MAQHSLDIRMRQKRDTSANWEQNNPIILDGEIILVDTADGELRAKIGDGVKNYSELPYADESIKVIYVGGGDMPADYEVQIDPSGTTDGIVSYTAGTGISIVDGVISINLVDAEGVAY